MNVTHPLSERIEPAKVRNHLRTVFGRELIHIPCCESTNDVLWTEIRNGAPGGTAVTTDYQTRGRGRMGRKWESPFGKDLLLSIATPIPAQETTGLLAIWGAVASADMLAKTGVDVQIKWPNDLYARGRKLGGILAEMRSGCDMAAVGIGLNVLSMPEDRPLPLRHKTISLIDLTGQRWDRSLLLADLLNSFGEWYEILAAEGWPAVSSRWRDLCPVKGRMVQVHHGKKTVIGLAEVTDPAGRLTLRDTDGKKLELASAEITDLVLLD